MTNFYARLPFETATRMEQLSRLMYELRENRRQLLAQYAVADEDALLQDIGAGRVAEHPAYEHYLGARTLHQAHAAVRGELRGLLAAAGEAPRPQTLHIDLKHDIERHYAAQLSAPIQLAQDALVLRLANGTALEIRYVDRAAYAFNWQWGEARLRIDTAPPHGGLTGGANHLHDAAGVVRADPLTRAGDDAWANTQRVLDALGDDPLLRAS